MSAYKMAIVLAAAAISCSNDAMAIGAGTVTAGTATITNPNPSTTLITQSTSKTVINWSGPGAFDTTAGQTVQFAQPSANAIALNIIGGGATNFEGNLLANGKVWLINPDGMLFGSTSRVNVSSLLLSTASISDPNGGGFYSNPGTTYNFDRPGNPTASITFDHASVLATGASTLGGDIIVQAPQITVTNASTLGTHGTVQLLAGETITADFNGDGMINFAVINTPVSAQVPGATSSIEVSNGSTVLGGSNVTIGASVFQDAVLDHVINLGGQYETGTYNQATNPQGVVINRPTVYENIVPNPPVTPSAVVTVPSSTANALNTIQSLTRPVASLGDETVKDTTVTPAVANVTYARPYLVNLPTSIAEGDLTLLAPAAPGAATPAPVGQGGPFIPVNPSALGNLSPSAGGTESANAADLGNLSPSAGGAQNIRCANAFLDAGWNAATVSGCPE